MFFGFLMTNAPGVPKFGSTWNWTWYVLFLSPLLVLVFPHLRYACSLNFPLPVSVEAKSKKRKIFTQISVVFQWNGPSYIFMIGLTWIDFCAAIYLDRSWSPRTRLFVTLDNDDFSFDDWLSALWARSTWAISQPRTTLVVLLLLHFWLPAGAWKNWLLKSTLAIELMLMIEEEWLLLFNIYKLDQVPCER